MGAKEAGFKSKYNSQTYPNATKTFISSPKRKHKSTQIVQKLLTPLICHAHETSELVWLCKTQ